MQQEELLFLSEKANNLSSYRIEGLIACGHRAIVLRVVCRLPDHPNPQRHYVLKVFSFYILFF
jgi:hypothetical protein